MRFKTIGAYIGAMYPTCTAAADLLTLDVFLLERRKLAAVPKNMIQNVSP